MIISMWTRYRAPVSVPYNDDVIKWKHFPGYWPFVRGNHQSLVISPHKGQWRGALMFSLICARINGWVNNRVAGDLRRRRAHYEVTVMYNYRRIWRRSEVCWQRRTRRQITPDDYGCGPVIEIRSWNKQGRQLKGIRDQRSFSVNNAGLDNGYISYSLNVEKQMHLSSTSDVYPI